MSNYDERITRLQGDLIRLIEDQAKFQVEITKLRSELMFLKNNPPGNVEPTVDSAPPPENSPPAQPQRPPQQYQTTPLSNYDQPKKYERIFSGAEPRSQKTETRTESALNLEKFIGENLISKIGIVILVIGVGIGAKYAIDNNWITPNMRVVLGYAIGMALVALAVKLKPKYLNFSAVLISGGMAIMYFITLFAYSVYGLINQSTAFVLMAIFTVFTVSSAVLYDRQIIAILGLVGAYLVPFLLSEGTGNYKVLFGYIAIINVGILAVSVKKYWKLLFYTSYLSTWLIFLIWYSDKYVAGEHFALGLTFLLIYFVTFYLTFIAYKLVSKENIAIENVGLVLTNAFVFYGFGYSILSRNPEYDHLLGMFTIANAVVHFAFAIAIDRLKLANKDLVYLSSILVLTFITIAAPVQIDGNFVTLVWSSEAAILFWIGRTKQIALFEQYSYPIMLLAFGSFLADLPASSGLFSKVDPGTMPLANQDFAVGLFFCAAFAFIIYLDRKMVQTSALAEDLRNVFQYAVAGAFIFALYNIFRIEIGTYYDYRLNAVEVANAASNTHNPYRANYSAFNVLGQINYTFFFLTVLSFINLKKLKNAGLGFLNIALSAFTVFFFLTVGLFLLDELRAGYFQPSVDGISGYGLSNVLIRYVCYAFFAGVSFATYKYSRAEFMSKYIPENVLNTVFDLGFYFAVMIITTVELLTWMDVFDFAESFKLGLTVFWGIYSLFLIILGIVLRKLHLRIMAIALFAVTLLKLFLYDIADLDTISKTVIFVSLGILLLIISFLYTKYKNVIFDESEPPAILGG